MNNKAIYGDPSNISIFDEPAIDIINSKTISRESKELLNLYSESFEGMPKSLSYDIGDVVKGKIYKITTEDILLDISGKDFAYVSVSKDKIDVESYAIGDEIETIVTDTESYLKVSIVEYIRYCLYSEMKGSGKGNIYDAKVLSLTANGYILDIQGVSVFMPGSLGGVNVLLDFEELVGNYIKVMPIKNDNKYSRHKDQLIVSHRAYLDTLIPLAVDKLEIGKVYTGTVTGTQPYGIFCEFNDVLTGMIHKDDFDEALAEMFDNGDVVAGREIVFYLKEIVHNKKLILSRFEVDSEEQKKQKEPVFKKGDMVDGKVIKTVKYGSFISLGRNATGLLHISKIKDGVEYEKGDIVNVKIIDNKNDKYVLVLT